MNTRLLVIAGLLSLSTWTAAQTSEGWTVQMILAQPEWLPGEPITVTLEMENKTDHLLPCAWVGEFYLDGLPAACRDRNQGTYELPPGVIFAAPDTVAKPIYPPGTRHTIAVCITRQCNMLARATTTVGPHKICYRQSFGSLPPLEACCDFVVRPPGGDEKAALALMPPTLRDVVTDASSLPPGLLEKYPTSAYAGYALLSGGQCIPDPRVFVTDLLSFDNHAAKWPQSSSQMAADKQRSLDADRKRVDQLSSYLKARPDFARADCLKAELAGRLAALQRFQEAEALCNEITSTDERSVGAKKALLLMDFLAERGYIKPAASSPVSTPAKASEATKGKSP